MIKLSNLLYEKIHFCPITGDNYGYRFSTSCDVATVYLNDITVKLQYFKYTTNTWTVPAKENETSGKWNVAKIIGSIELAILYSP